VHERRIFEEVTVVPDVGQLFTLNPDNSRHLSLVLRLNPGDPVTVVFLPFEFAFECFVAEVSNKKVIIKVQNKFLTEEFRSVISNLALGICKMAALEFIVEKATELGVQKFSLIQSEHSVLRLKSQSEVESKIDRLTKIAISASKQSSRITIPKFEYYNSVDTFLTECMNQIKVLASLEAEAKMINNSQLAKDNNKISDVCGCIGPEGDFSNSEIAKFKAANFEFISLGGNRLRSETAAISLIAGFDAVFSN
jgi:16S rRNA (uracil1498-N3)-methyltransferase